MIGRASTPTRDLLGNSSSAMLAGCDESLSTIAADVAGLLDELEQLRGLAGRLADQHTEQQAVVERQRSQLDDLHAERSRARQWAEELRAAETRLKETDGRAASLELELGTLRETVSIRDRHVAEIEAELAGARQALRHRDATVGRATERLAGLELDREGVVTQAAGAHGSGEAFRRSTTGHVRFLGSPDGYRLESSDERCARPGDVIEIEGRSFLVTRVGSSPLPDDRRPCAFLTAGTSGP